MTARFTARYDAPEEFLDAYDAEVTNGGLLVRGAAAAALTAGAECEVEVVVPGQAPVVVPARVAAVARVGIAVTFDGEVPALHALAAALRGAKADEAPAPAQGTVAQRLASLTVGQKIATALSGDRETRIALLRDHNKTLHAYVLRNPRIGLDEVQWAAKLTTLSPEALKVISEHVDWGKNLTICASLVRNPRTPLPIALRLLPRLSPTDVRAIAKGGARDQLVHAARKLLNV